MTGALRGVKEKVLLAGRMEGARARQVRSSPPEGGGQAAPRARRRGSRPRGAGTERKERRMALWQLAVGSERRLARGPAGEGPRELLGAELTIDALLAVPGALDAELHGPSA